jgi:hypothetical protein
VNTTQPAIPMESHPSPMLADERKRDSAWVHTIHLHLQYSGSTTPGERTCSTMTWASSLAMFSSTCLREHRLAAAFSRIWASYFTFSSPDLEAAWGKQAEQSCQRSHQIQANQTRLLKHDKSNPQKSTTASRPATTSSKVHRALASTWARAANSRPNPTSFATVCRVRWMAFLMAR